MASFSSHIVTRINLLTELKQAWVFLLITAAVVSIFVTLPLDWSIEKRARWIGMVFQILGIASVIVGIEKTRKHFRLPSITDEAVTWVKSFLRGKRAPYVVMLKPGVSLEIAMPVSARITARLGADLEERVRVLEGEVGRLHDRIDSVSGHMDNQVYTLKNELALAKKALQQKEKEIKELVTLAHTGGLKIELVGAIWLILGVICATAPGEITGFTLAILSGLHEIFTFLF